MKVKADFAVTEAAGWSMESNHIRLLRYKSENVMQSTWVTLESNKRGYFNKISVSECLI